MSRMDSSPQRWLESKGESNVAVLVEDDSAVAHAPGRWWTWRAIDAGFGVLLKARKELSGVQSRQRKSRQRKSRQRKSAQSVREC
mmetsp:Transcript_21727/g.54656  ORF Transcript_21727/g.54656 Transcript_21727/m.54656 type:complete len:85 (-) Transcript_21727:14-268(-)